MGVRIFSPDDLLGREEAIWKILPDADWQLCVFHTMCQALHKARKTDWEVLAHDLKALSEAETKREAKDMLQRLRVRWGTIYPWVVSLWEIRANTLLAFLCHFKPIRMYL